MRFIELLERLKDKTHGSEVEVFNVFEKVKEMQIVLRAPKGEQSDVIQRFIGQELEMIATGLNLHLQGLSPARAEDYQEYCLNAE